VADIRRKVGAGPELRPIGFVRSPFKDPSDLPAPAFAPPRFLARAVGEIEICPEFARGLDGLEAFSHIIAIFHFHRAGTAKLTAVPPGRTEPRGVFATRSPRRPNPLGLTVLKLIGREGRVLRVSGLDLINGTPVLDIKPYTGRDRKSHFRTGRAHAGRRAGR
jgi:tRNA-Thr(GGU) m(6)t(6)A37 methyltransferase TsaA